MAVVGRATARPGRASADAAHRLYFFCFHAVTVRGFHSVRANNCVSFPGPAILAERLWMSAGIFDGHRSRTLLVVEIAPSGRPVCSAQYRIIQRDLRMFGPYPLLCSEQRPKAGVSRKNGVLSG